MLKIATIIFAVAGLLSLGIAVAEEEIENLARNGGFENDMAEWPLIQGIRGSVGMAEIDRKDSIEGKKSMFIQIDVASDFHTHAHIAVKDRVVLDVRSRADDDLPLVSPNHRVEPHTGIRQDFHIPVDPGPFGNKDRFVYVGR